MMRPEIERIAEQVRWSYAGEAWHGPSVAEVLQDVDAAMATARPVPGAHSIAEIVAHLDFTQRTVLDRLEGRGRLTTEQENFPAVPRVLSEEQWDARLRELEAGAKALEQAVSTFDPERLDSILVKGGSPAYNNIMGHTQHNAYHAGQIALLKKLVRG